MNPYTVDVEIDALDSTQLPASTAAEVARAAVLALQLQAAEAGSSLTIRLTGDDAIRDLNRIYRGFDEPTDVLSFADGTQHPDGTFYLGDIAISVPTAARQALEQQEPLLQELLLLAVHGVLHLLGHDHAEPEEKARMWAAQEAILAGL